MATSIVFRNVARRSFGLFRGVRTTSLSSVRFATTYYTPAHEYISVDGNIGTVGITDYAQSALGDIVFVDLPEVGDEFEKGDSFGSVESVKAASDVYLPMGGTIKEVNEELSDEPGIVNKKAETDAWFVKLELENPEEAKELMEEDAYKKHCENEAHH